MRRIFHEMKIGWDSIQTPKGILYMTLLMTVATFCIGFLQTLMPPLMLTFTDETTLGKVESLCAIGMLVTSLWIGIKGLPGKAPRVLALGIAASGVAMALVGTTINVRLIVLFGFVFFAALPFINTSADYLIRINVPNEFQGRAWGIIGIVSQFGFIFAYGFSGVLADNVFNPWLMEGGALSGSVGKLIGVGAGRGIGLLLILTGALMAILGWVVSRSGEIAALNQPQTPVEGKSNAI